jgi:hypothetical protein
VAQFITENNKLYKYFTFHHAYVFVRRGSLSLTEVVTLLSLTEVMLPGIVQDRIASKLLPQNFPKLQKNFSDLRYHDVTL